MDRIDAHCHFWQLSRGDYGWLDGRGGPLDRIRRDFLPADYPQSTGCIAVQAAPTVAETDYLLALAKADPRILGVVGWIDLTAPDAVAQIRARAGQAAFKGIRPMLQDIGEVDWLERAVPGDTIAALIHAGLRFDALVTARHLPMLARFARRHADLPLIVDHAAKPQPGGPEDWQAGMQALAALPHVRCKLSGLMTELTAPQLHDPLSALRPVVSRLLDWFGPERLVWGSDWPVLTLVASYQEWLDLTDQLLAGLTSAERQAIMSTNAAGFYGVAP